MQDQHEPIGEVAVSSGERSFIISLRVDWNRNGLYNHELSDMSRFVKSASTDRALQGAAPEELGFISGSAAAQLSVTLAGEDSQGRNLTSIFSPYQINSPFWTLDPVGCEIEYQIGIDAGAAGVLWYPQFIGQIRTISPDRGSSRVDITALDRVEALRQAVGFAPWAVSESHAQLGRLQAQLMWGHHVIDTCLRLCDVSCSPYRPITTAEIGSGEAWTGPQVFLTGNGGLTPAIGWMDNITRQEFPATELGVLMYEELGVPHPSAPDTTKKPYVFAAVGNLPDSDTLVYWAKSRQQIASNAAQVLGFTLIQDQGQQGTWWSVMPETKVMFARTNDEIELQIYMEAGDVWTEWDRQGAHPAHIIGPSVTIPAGTSCDIHVCWDPFFPSGGTVYISAGANNSGLVSVSNPGVFGGGDELAGLVEITRQVAMQDVYFTTTHFWGVGNGLIYRPKAAKYAASLDPGLNRLSNMPIPDKREAWDVIKSVADAEVGAVFWDEEGKFRFWNFNTIQEKRSTIVRELTLDDVDGLDITRSLDSVRNVYAMDQSKARSVTDNVYVSQDVDEFYVPAGTRKYFQLFIDDVISPEPRFMDRYKSTSSDPVPAWNDNVRHGYVFQFFQSGVWSEAVTGSTAGIDINSYLDENGFVVVNIWNGWSVPIRLASGSGSDSQPAFRLQGTRTVRYDDQTVITKDDASITKYGPRTLKLNGEWYQDESNFNNILSEFLARTTSPSPSSDRLLIAGDPRLQLGDAIRIKDKPGFGEHFDVQIYGITRTFDIDSGLTDSLAVQLVPAGGKWDDPVYGIWGSTFVWT